VAVTRRRGVENAVGDVFSLYPSSLREEKGTQGLLSHEGRLGGAQFLARRHHPSVSSATRQIGTEGKRRKTLLSKQKGSSEGGEVGSQPSYAQDTRAHRASRSLHIAPVRRKKGGLEKK